MSIKVLNMLGLAAKARFIVSGEDGVIKGLQTKKVQMVFVAKDATDKTIKRFENKCFFYSVPICLDYDSEELSKAIGKERKIVGLCDVNFTNAIKKLMEGNE